MKKKLVAFAVTAAMVITSAVPALAWTATGDSVPESNEVVLTSTHLEGGIVENYNHTKITDDAEYSITVDMNRTGGSYQYVLNMTGNNGKEYQQILGINRDSGSHVFIKGHEANEDLCGVSGITTLTWRFDTSHDTKFVEMIVDDQGIYGTERTYVIELDPEVEYVESVVFEGWGGNDVSGTAVVYQNQIPDEVASVEVVLADKTGTPILDRYGDFQVVDQPVIKDWYVVKSITFNDGTVINGWTVDDNGNPVEVKNVTGDKNAVEEYVNLSWEVTKRDGTAMNMYDAAGNKLNDKSYGGTEFYVSDKYEGAYVTLTVTGNKTSGIFGETTWGEDAESLAIQQRIAGDDRYDTAMKVADQMNDGTGFDKIFVATGTNYADALSVTALANKVDAPILLVNAAHEDEVAAYIKANLSSYNAEVYIVGGTSAVSASFEKELKKFVVDVERIAGDTRYDTNIEVLKAFDNDETKGGIGTVNGSMGEILVASGMDYPDALSAAATGKPVLLVGDELTKAQRTYLHDVISTYSDVDYVIVGGRVAVSDDIKDELLEKAYSANSVTRVGGVNRYETNMMVMDKFVPTIDSAKYVFVASGMDYPDALTGGVLAAQNGAPLALVNANVTDPASDTVDRVADNTDYAGMVVIGGENAVSNATVQKIA